MSELTKRIRTGLTAFAVGDALGVPWEGRPAAQIERAEIDRVPRRGDWPPGATSDDTAQTLLMATYLAELGAVVDERAFLDLLAAEVDSMRGAGPSTRAAVRRFTTTGAVIATSGSTNGAPMRALPIGWAVPGTAAERRRELTVGLSRTTHGESGAIGAACLVSAMGSAAVDGTALDALVGVALDELDWVARYYGAGVQRFELVRRAAACDWSPDAAGVTLDAVETVAAVVHVVRHAGRTGDSLADMLRYAVSLGGDTDTVAAIAGGVLGCRQSEADLPWKSSITMPDDARLDALSEALSALRRQLSER